MPLEKKTGFAHARKVTYLVSSALFSEVTRRMPDPEDVQIAILDHGLLVVAPRGQRATSARDGMLPSPFLLSLDI